MAWKLSEYQKRCYLIYDAEGKVSTWWFQEVIDSWDVDKELTKWKVEEHWSLEKFYVKDRVL